MKTFFIYLLVFITSSCAGFKEIKPKEDVQQIDINSIDDLVGTYKNQGDPEGYITELLWGSYAIRLSNTEVMRHDEIELVNIIKSDNTLTVQAINNNCVFLKKDYLYGEDFDITDGKIILLDETSYSSSVSVGPSTNIKQIGLEKDGSGLYHEQENSAVLLMMILPVIYHNKSLLKFYKLDASQTYSKCQ